MDKTLKHLVAEAKAQGWMVTITRNGHWRFKPPHPDRRIVFTGGTPSDKKARLNLRKDLEREGLQLHD